MDIFLFLAPSSQAKTRLMVLFGGKVGAPAILRNVRKTVVGGGGVVGTDDARSVDLEVDQRCFLIGTVCAMGMCATGCYPEHVKLDVR